MRNVTKFGTVTQPVTKMGRKRLLSATVEDDLLCYLSQRPTAYLDEMKWFLYDEHDIVITTEGVRLCLNRRGWSRKIVILHFYSYSSYLTVF
jgi:transposase